jgi:DNA-binding transcriptional regulator YhcF (GntR family)
MIGVRRNSVSTVAHTLQKAGLIRYRRGYIEIVDLKGLMKTSCECHEMVKTRCDSLLKPGIRHGLSREEVFKVAGRKVSDFDLTA